MEDPEASCPRAIDCGAREALRTIQADIAKTGFSLIRDRLQRGWACRQLCGVSSIALGLGRCIRRYPLPIEPAMTEHSHDSHAKRQPLASFRAFACGGTGRRIGRAGWSPRTRSPSTI